MKKNGERKNPERWIETSIKDFINRSPENTLKNRTNEKAWEDPLVGFSSGNDPLYQEYSVISSLSAETFSSTVIKTGAPWV